MKYFGYVRVPDFMITVPVCSGSDKDAVEMEAYEHVEEVCSAFGIDYNDMWYEVRVLPHKELS